MKCPFCNKENPDGAKFCGGCGKSLESAGHAKESRSSGRVPKQKLKKKKITVIAVAVAVILAAAAAAFLLLRQNAGTAQTYERDESLIAAGAGNMQLIDLTSYGLTAADSEEALEVIDSLADILNIAGASELELKNEYTVNGSTYYRFQQTFRGLIVFGRSIVLSADSDENVQLITEDLADTDSAAEEAEIDEAAAISAAEAYLAADSDEDSTDTVTDEAVYESTLCYYAPSGSDTAILAYAVTAGTSIVFIDAECGIVLGESTQLYELSDELTGQNGTLTVDVTDNGDGTYSLVDGERGISVYSMAIQTYPLDEDLAYNPDSYSNFVNLVTYTDDTDRDSAVDALYNTEVTYDFYKTLFGHISTDGNGAASIYIFETVQFVEVSSGRNGEIKEYIDNAFSFGNGTDISCIAICPTTYETTFADELDIIAHEYTHQVISFTCAVENGSLNEGLADIMGELVQGWSTGAMDWIMGADIGNGDYIRNIISPDGDNLSSYADYTDETEGHSGSTILSHAAYLMWEGSDDTDSIEAIDDVEILAELWYRTMLLMTSDATFADCRAACEAAAAQMRDSGLLTDGQVNAVIYAFDTCGIEYAGSLSITTDKSLIVTIYDGDKNETDDYHCVITNQNGDVTDEFDGSDIGSAFQVDFNEEGIYKITVSYDTYNYPSVTAIVTVGSESLFKLASLTDAELDIYTTFGTNITGKVTDESGNTLDNVNVTAEGTSGYSYSTASNDGSYILYLPVGSYEVTYEMDGYETMTVQQDVAIGTNQAETVLNAEETEASELKLYAEILDLFYYGISSQWEDYWDNFGSDSEGASVSYLWYWPYAEDCSLSDAGFALIDLDSDGVCELLVSQISEDGSSYIRDLYACRDGEITHLASSGERFEYWLCTDSSSGYLIGYRGSGGASSGGYNYYEVNSDSDELVLLEKLDYEYSDGASAATWYYSDSAYASEYSTSDVTVISDDEAQAIIDSYVELEYDLTPFSEYTPSDEAAKEETEADAAYNALSDFVEAEGYLSAITPSDYGYDSFEDLVDNGCEPYYVIDDLNADGNSELLICASDWDGFYFTWTFVYYQGDVCLIDEFYGYGQFRYSSVYNAVVVPCETRPDAYTNAVMFYQIDGADLNWLFSIIYDTDTWYYYDPSGKEALDTTYSESEYSEGIEDLAWVPLE